MYLLGYQIMTIEFGFFDISTIILLWLYFMTFVGLLPENIVVRPYPFQRPHLPFL